MDELSHKDAQDQIKVAEAIISENHVDLQNIITPAKSHSIEESISIYSENYYARLNETLNSNFPVTNKLFPLEFDEIKIEYSREVVSISYNLNEYGRNLTKYIKNSNLYSLHPQVFDLINLEDSFTKLFHAGKQVKGLSTDQLANFGIGEDITIEFIQDLYLFNSQYPIYSWWDNQSREENHKPFPFFIYKQDEIKMFKLSQYQYLIMHNLIAGETVVNAISNAGSQSTEDKKKSDVSSLFSFLSYNRLIATVYK